MVQLFQAEWCPFSHLVRQRLTELGVDFVARQVPPEPQERDDLERETGERSIPVLVLDDGTVIGGETRDILAALDERYPETPFTAGHQERRSEARTFE
jgi:glutathione S-transferase